MTEKKPDDVCTCGHKRVEHGHFDTDCFAIRKRNFFQALIGTRRFCPCPSFTPKQKEPDHD